MMISLVLFFLLGILPLLHSRSYFEVSQGLASLHNSDKKIIMSNALCNRTIQTTVYSLIQDISTDIAPTVETYITLSSSILAVNYTITYRDNYYTLLKNRLKSSVANQNFTHFLNEMAYIYDCSPLQTVQVLLQDLRISPERTISDDDSTDDALNIEEANNGKALSNVLVVMFLGLIVVFILTVFKVLRDHPEIKQDPKVFAKEVYQYLYQKLERKDPDDRNENKTIDDTENPLNTTSEATDESSMGNIYAEKDDNFGMSNKDVRSMDNTVLHPFVRGRSRQSIEAIEILNILDDDTRTAKDSSSVTDSTEMLSQTKSALKNNNTSSAGRASVSFTLREAADMRKKASTDISDGGEDVSRNSIGGPLTNIPFGGSSSSSGGAKGKSYGASDATKVSSFGTSNENNNGKISPPSSITSSSPNSTGANMAALAKRRTSVVTPSAMKKALQQTDNPLRRSLVDGKDSGGVVWHSNAAVGGAATSPERRQELEKLNNLLNEFDK